MVQELLASLALPFDLSTLLNFTLVDSFTQELANSSCNNFFESYSARDGSGRIRVRREGSPGQRCWDSLPSEWREYFQAIKEHEKRNEVLKELSKADTSSPIYQSFPSSLQSFLSSCRSLSFDRTCSLNPILSYPPSSSSGTTSRPRQPSPPPSINPALAHLKGKAKAQHTNALKAGQSPKKHHEVVKFCSLVESMLTEEPSNYCVDVGSGRAHLSRALASPPLNLHVLAVDWAPSQKTGAEKLDRIRQRAELNPTIGSLTHRVSSLDEPGVKKVLKEWPPVYDEDSSKKREPPLLVALHACGDLTPDSIKAFTDFSSSSSSLDSLSSAPRAVFVGCCYNLQTPSLFPLSQFLASILPIASLPNQNEPISLAHLRLTPQSPPTWHLSQAETKAFESATFKLAYRSRLEAELEWNGFGSEIGARKVGRIPDCRDWNEYRGKAIERMVAREGEGVKVPLPCPFGEEGEREKEEEDWKEGVWLLRVWWTIRSWLGPPLESLVVLDRYLLLVEGLYGTEEEDKQEGEGRKVEMVNIFDQATGSLRNIALVVR
ncbi:uncharacterized protein JCM6883_002545 [Sporobolomyces salmoneus]|uniref:uncharacterized protein n=1 Tax=Sporobolomyces salmoneus TaxID=183962 RepID=UPI00317DB9F3